VELWGLVVVGVIRNIIRYHDGMEWVRVEEVLGRIQSMTVNKKSVATE
jgi:hypothetical protein